MSARRLRLPLGGEPEGVCPVRTIGGRGRGGYVYKSRLLHHGEHESQAGTMIAKGPQFRWSRGAVLYVTTQTKVFIVPEGCGMVARIPAEPLRPMWDEEVPFRGDSQNEIRRRTGPK